MSATEDRAGACPACGCSAPARVHAVAGALMIDDVDAAIEAGLLDAIACPACDSACAARMACARDARVAALAARDRYRLRETRLARRAAERNARRAAAARLPSALPAAAAAALARAKAKAGKP